MEHIERNLHSVRERIAAACGRAGRDPSEVTLVAVTKTVGPEEVRELYRLGVRNFGENRVANGVAQLEILDESSATWHLIGHLQRNKAAQALAGGFRIIHSVESAKLVEVLGRECEKLDVIADIFLEVNIAGEESKYGIDDQQVTELARLALAAPRLKLVGLMTMAPFTDNPEDSRPVFRALRECRDRLRGELGATLPHLSMGMTGDFEVAVEEGATLVRVGTALYVQ